MLEFQELPINTLIGAKWNAFKKIAKNRQVDKGYRKKYFLTKGICLILNSISFIEQRVYRKKLEKLEMNDSPLFVIGHWRSGTTFVHNIMACDKQFGYTTTYQTVFPNIMLWGQKFFKACMSSVMPDKRPTDNMELKVDLPQEEEFAISNLCPYSFYNFWVFPRSLKEYRKKYLLFEDTDKKEEEEFKEVYKRLVKTSLYNTGRKRYLSKNPPHTGHIPQLLDMFPNAKFIYLVRNPYTVFESTRSFFTNTIQPLKLQDYSNEQIEQDVIETYKELYEKYEKDKALIPAGNLVEIKFEEFEADAFETTKNIYEKLSLGGFEQAREDIEKYLGKKKGYKKNKYSYDPRAVKIVDDNWSFALKQWGYTLD